MKTLYVELGDRRYPIHIGPGLLTQRELLRPHIPGRQALVVSNTTVAPLYLEPVCAALDGLRHEAVILPDGEQYKTLDMLNEIFTALLNHRFDRNCTVIALGGGVIGDMAGFAAACYQRGVHFIQIPTTLLAQVDSSVGGKTAVNHPLGKNMIGAFYQPLCVLADTDTLATLPDRELSAGLAEVIKYGLIRDVPFLAWLETNLEALMARDAAALSEAIERSCRNKAEIVAADERETGERALLNLGHTFGHAIETGVGYGEWLHGEAVAAGMIMAADLSARIGWLDQAQVDRVRQLLARARLPLQPPLTLTPDDFLRLMAVDKKVKDGRLRLILLRDLGQAVIASDTDPHFLRETLKHVYPPQ
ncbi:MAG TPA: 3-dehydroquinate synthase [Candidatus Competibacteraceae bacterium]|nr:3-dehydroquinate synthase [Candidatus Competibacteraceae bacterium]MCP5133399.1 3-dehydroquinate synthase [Gammaproteobacteria bacterium]HPF57208.1 3-dehydroquinate synthase [Candidatus Competibacteraceae bacterium]